MADLQSSVAQAKSAGYSGDEILAYLSKSRPDLNSKIQQARSAGYGVDDIVGHLATPKPSTASQIGDAASSFVGETLHLANPATMISGAGAMLAHPIDTLTAGMQGFRDKAVQDVKNGDYWKALNHGVAGVVPVLGPAFGNTVDAIDSGDASAVGRSAADLTAAKTVPAIYKGVGSAAGATVSGVKAAAPVVKTAGPVIANGVFEAGKMLPVVGPVLKSAARLWDIASEVKMALNGEDAAASKPVMKAPPVTFKQGASPVAAPPVSFKQGSAPVEAPPVTFKQAEAPPVYAAPPVTFKPVANAPAARVYPAPPVRFKTSTPVPADISTNVRISPDISVKSASEVEGTTPPASGTTLDAPTSQTLAKAAQNGTLKSLPADVRADLVKSIKSGDSAGVNEIIDRHSAVRGHDAVVNTATDVANKVAVLSRYMKDHGINPDSLNPAQYQEIANKAVEHARNIDGLITPRSGAYKGISPATMSFIKDSLKN